MTRKRGFIVPGPRVNLATALVANAASIFTLPTVLGPSANLTPSAVQSSLIVRSLRFRNNGGGNTFLHVGTGVGGTFADLVPAAMTLNNVDGGWTEVEIPDAEAFATITAYPESLAAAGSIDVEIEVEVVN